MGWKTKLGTIALATAAGGWLIRTFFCHPAARVQMPPIRYRGNDASKVVHRPGCRHYDPNKLPAEFSSVEEAAGAGFRACGLCIGRGRKGA